ncbi:hypothetical protein TNCV_1052881 [Trichonephila clavipes]|nr:hypothetical protein TNCV_1052881 [Trichonephila clavipes]
MNYSGPDYVDGYSILILERNLFNKVLHDNEYIVATGVLGKIHFNGWHRSSLFPLYNGSKRFKRHRSLPMKVQVSSTHLSFVKSKFSSLAGVGVP